MAAIINIYGTARSGSTMLDLILGNAENSFSCGEVSAWFRPYRSHHFRVKCSCEQVHCPVWERLMQVPESQFHVNVIKNMHVDFVIDSSKDICWLLDTHKWVAPYKINTINILIWKNPIDLAYSYWKRGFDINHWRNIFVNTYSKFFETDLPFHAVNLNNLRSNPANIISEICGVIGMRYFDGKERFWEKEHHYLFGSGNVRRQVQKKSSHIYSKVSYSPEFENRIESLQAQIMEDTRVSEIIRNLNAYDISVFNNENQHLVLKQRYPIWYYRKRLIRSIKRYLPEKTSVSN